MKDAIFMEKKMRQINYFLIIYGCYMKLITVDTIFRWNVNELIAQPSIMYIKWNYLWKTMFKDGTTV